MNEREFVDRRTMDNPCRKTSERKKPHFFKVLIGDFERRLRIPQAFVKHMCDEKCERVILRDPRGKRWRVKLRRTANDLYLQGGWKKFSKAHSLKAGEFLVFRYDGNMRFNVKIFASNACQRDDDAFALNKCVQDSASNLRNKRRSGKKLQGFEQNIGRRTPKSCLKTSLLSQHSPKCEERTVILWQSPNQYGQQSDSNQAGLIVPRIEGPEPHWIKTSEELKAKQAAYSYTSHFPYFVSEMKLSHVQRPFHMTVPCRFARQHLPRESTKMTLLNTQGNTWKVNFHISVNQHMFCGGWNCFSQDNNLKRGDHCAFELVDQLVMRVHVIRVGNPSSSCPLLMWKNTSEERIKLLDDL